MLELDLRLNSPLRSVPEEITQLTEIEVLDLSGNPIRQISETSVVQNAKIKSSAYQKLSPYGHVIPTSNGHPRAD